MLSVLHTFLLIKFIFRPIDRHSYNLNQRDGKLRENVMMTRSSFITLVFSSICILHM